MEASGSALTAATTDGTEDSPYLGALRRRPSEVRDRTVTLASSS